QRRVVANRGGAGGTIGGLQAAKADPDGYTWLFDASNHTVAPAIYGNPTYDPANDFSGVAIFGTIPNVLLVSPDKGIKTVQELVARAKTQELTFSSAGVGSATHWAAERFRITAGFKATHVPFRAGTEELTEVLTGRLDLRLIAIASSLVFIKEGKLVPLCVTSPQRSPSLPDVVTSTEAGYKDSHYNFWNGLLLPAKTPRAIVDRLHADVAA